MLSSRLIALSVVGLVVTGAACSGGGGEIDPARSAAPDAEEQPGSTSSAAPTTEATTTTTTTTTPTSEPVTEAPTTRAAPPCDETSAWGIDSKESAPMLPEDLYLARVGQHACYDRLVFDINGVVEGPEAVGFHVAYVDGDVQADGSGERVPTDGAASLEVIVRAPALGYSGSGHQPGRFFARVGEDLVDESLASWTALRDVTFAGSFEGQSTIAVGAVAEVPFRVGVVEDAGYTHLYVDIAHAP